MSFGKALCIQKYTDKSIIVRGEETKARKEEIKKIPGYKFAFYEGAAGWMFPADKEAEVRRVLGITTPYVGGMKSTTTEPSSQPEYKKAAAPRGKLRSALPSEDSPDTPPPTAASETVSRSPVEQMVVLVGEINGQLTKIFDRLDAIDNRVGGLATQVETLREQLALLVVSAEEDE
jgi:hypothetical protein